MVNLNAHVRTITAHLTNDQDIGGLLGKPSILSVSAAVAYLEASPQKNGATHAIVIADLEEYDGFPAVVPGLQVAVFRRTSDRPQNRHEGNFYVQALPLDDPNDADGGDWTAEEAIADALDLLCALS